MKRIFHGDDFMAAALAINAGEFDRGLAPLGPAVAKENLPRERAADDFLGELRLLGMVKIVRDMDQFPNLIPHGGHHLRMAMPDVIHPPPGEKIKILFPRDVGQDHPFALNENPRRAGIGRKDVFVVIFVNLILCQFEIVCNLVLVNFIS